MGFCAMLCAMRAARPALSLVLACFASGFVGACAGERREVGPEATLTALSNALAQGDTRGAYALMTPSYREHVSFEEFAARMKANPSEAKDLASALGKRAERRDVSEVRLSDGTRLRLVRDGERYLLETPVTDFYAQDTPRAALASFIRAVENRRWDVLWALMPEADRQGVTPEVLGKNLQAQLEELTRIVVLLKSSQELPIEIVGDRATMPYGESFTARFLRENERWKVEDPE
jgi:hypothetical protein